MNIELVIVLFMGFLIGFVSGWLAREEERRP